MAKKKKDKYEELGGEFVPVEELEERLDEEGENIAEEEAKHFEESDK
jgi:hypothetical protein